MIIHRLLSLFSRTQAATPPPPKVKLKVIPPSGYRVYQFGNVAAVARSEREARRMVAGFYTDFLKRKKNNELQTK